MAFSMLMSACHDQNVVFSNPPDAYGERHIVIVIASYNNESWYKWNLDSVFEQNYKNYHVIYIDDASSDSTPRLVEQYIKEKEQQNRVTLVKNKQRLGSPLGNQFSAIYTCNDRDIIVILDGDDKFAHPNVLTFVNSVYADSNVWLTYGQFIEYPSNVHGFCCQVPENIVRNNAFRDFGDIPSHLRTFYAGLFKQIDPEDLKYEGEFFKMTGDMGAMLPMIEMARDHFKFIPQILYVYNASNPISEHRVSKQLQRKIDLFIRGKRRYDKITSPIRSTNKTDK